MIVVDTDIITAMTLPTKYSAVVHNLHERNPGWHAPLLWRSEYLDVLAFFHRRNVLTYQEMMSAFQFAERLIGRGEHTIDPLAVAGVIAGSRASAFDCEFVALAKSLEVRLITNDATLIREFPDLAMTPENYLRID